MTPEQLLIKIQEWDSEYPPPNKNETAKYTGIYAVLNYLSEEEWKAYLPAEHPDHSSQYIERLAAWVGSTKDEDEQKVLLEYALYISFFSHDDFNALYQASFEREAAQWVAQSMEASLFSADECRHYGEDVQNELYNHTWFCPVSDSMNINSFYKVNNIKGIRHRPSFMTLEMLARGATAEKMNSLTNKLKAFMDNPGFENKLTCKPLKRLVLLEDFVGTGSQSRAALEWALAALNCPILFIPLIIAPQGYAELEQLMNRSAGRLIIRPVVTLGKIDLIGPNSEGNTWPFALALEALVGKHYAPAWKKDRIDRFGFENTGCSVVLHSNAPNNSVSLIHCISEDNGWHALFPRVKRD